MDNKIMVLDRVEALHDDKENVIGRLVTDKAGNQLKIKKGQSGKLENRWDELGNGIGKAFEFTMRTFTPPGKTESYPFVADFKEVKDVLLTEAVRKATEAMPSEQDAINRRAALLSAKDIAVANINQGKPIDREAILSVADDFINWLKGGQGVKTETPKESKTDDNTEILEPEDGPEVSWESIRPKLSELYNQKMLTMDKTLKQLADLGADISSRNVKVAFESLNLESKQKFAKIIVGITAKKED